MGISIKAFTVYLFYQTMLVIGARSHQAKTNCMAKYCPLVSSLCFNATFDLRPNSKAHAGERKK